MARALLVCLAAIALVAATCGDGDDDNGVLLGTGIEGLVTIGPICPVEQADSPCPDQPYQATIVIQDEDGNEVTRVMSGEDGRFRAAVAPGSYTLVPQSPNAGAPPQAAEQVVEVRAGEYTHVEIQYDSGIR